LLALYILVAVCTGGTCELLVVAATTVPDGRNHRCSAVLILLPWLSVAWRCSAQHAAQCIRRAGAYWSDLQVWPVLCCTHAQVAAHSRSAHPPPWLCGRTLPAMDLRRPQLPRAYAWLLYLWHMQGCSCAHVPRAALEDGVHCGAAGLLPTARHTSQLKCESGLS
jgi:hypothetical protein